MKRIIDLMERGVIPDALIRQGIQRLNRLRLRQEKRGDPAAQLQAKLDFIRMLRNEPVAVETDAANEQHYEVPAAFFEQRDHGIKQSIRVKNCTNLPGNFRGHAQLFCTFCHTPIKRILKSAQFTVAITRTLKRLIDALNHKLHHS